MIIQKNTIVKTINNIYRIISNNKQNITIIKFNIFWTKTITSELENLIYNENNTHISLKKWKKNIIEFEYMVDNN